MLLIKTSILLVLFVLYSSILEAGQATIIEAEGYACMGDDKSKKQTEQLALSDAKRKASEAALTYIKSETTVLDSELQQDLVAAYSNAQIKVIQELGNSWYKDASAGDCFKTKIKAEVSPDMKSVVASEKLNKAPIDLSWHRYKNRKQDVFNPHPEIVNVTVPSDGWRIIGPTTENKEEFEWGWEVTVKFTLPHKASNLKKSWKQIAEIKYILTDDDGFVLASESLNISKDNTDLADTLWELDEDKTSMLLQEIGTTRTYRQTSRLSIQKASRVKAGKFQVTVK